ncbi:hypothetical protein GMLC_16480 [Geomonas limicola]|uniref:Right handed beta helix domain-containing protein n=1 Tax=Geomonas limicola TaxID=2740186 RepID=A0A6V8N9Y2_9BACT|nr:hypothetical protein GMLC_16480 [Geomonas limicola]
MIKPFPIATLGLLVAAHLFAASAFGAGLPVGVASAASAPAAAVEAPARAELAFRPQTVYGSRVVSEDTTWRGEVLVDGVLVIAPQATLTVEPGAVVRFRRNGSQAAQLVVQGRLIVSGTRETPVLFGSALAEPQAADWQGILLLGSEKKNILENCRIEGAESGLEALYSTVILKGVKAARSQTGFRFQDALVTMEGGGATDCDTAVRLSESEATLRGVVLSGNRQGINALHSSLYLADATLSGNRSAGFAADGCRIKFQGGQVAGNGSGVTLLGCEGSILGAKLMKNREFGLSLSASRVKVVGNQIFGNGNNGVIVTDGAAAAWDNAIYENAGFDLYHSGLDEFRAPANWWGGGQPKVFDNNGRGRVLFSPVLGAKPQSMR